MEKIDVDGLRGRYYPGDRGTFLLVHGLASSSGEFFDYPEKINSHGFGVIVFDLSGHGESKGIRGYESIEKNIQDINKVVENLGSRIKRPLILLGHSLGAATVIYALAGGIGDMCIAIAPPASIKGEMNIAERMFLPLIYVMGVAYERITGRRFYIKYRAVYEKIFREPGTVQIAREMGFLQDRIWIRSYKPLMAVDTVNAARMVKKPCMVIIPDGDRLVNPENQRKVYEALTGEKRLYIARGYNHSLMGEDKGEIIGEIIRFAEEIMENGAWGRN